MTFGICRKDINKRRLFLYDDSVIKIVYLAINEASKMDRADSKLEIGIKPIYDEVRRPFG